MSGPTIIPPVIRMKYKLQKSWSPEAGDKAVASSSQPKPAGNTKIPLADAPVHPYGKVGKPKYQLYRWVFTLNYELSQASQLCQVLKEHCKEFVFSGELSKTGYKHWQGCLSLKNKEYFDTIKNLLFPNQVHLEGCNNWFKAKAYCKKSETHIEGPYDEKSIFIKTIEELRPWQQNIEKICCEEPDDRSVYWLWDNGNTGKTSFCKYMAVKYNALIFNNGAFKDIAYAIPLNPRIVIFNITRDLEEKVNYSAIEAIKDGMIFSAKYESGMKLFNSPHVIIFANFPPDLSRLSSDRWKIINNNIIEKSETESLRLFKTSS